MSIIRKAFKIFNGSAWDEYHLKTDSKQVVHTKKDGTDTTVEEQLNSLNSTLKSAIKFVDYSVTLESNAYVTPFSYYLNKYLPASDVEKYGIPIAATLATSSGQAHPVSLSLSYIGQYHYTAVATAGSGIMTVVYLKL